MITQIRYKRMIGWLGGSLLLSLAATTSRAGLNAYYSFDDASNPPSSLGTDNSGSGFNLTASGTPTAGAGVDAGAASFNGTNAIFQGDATKIYPNSLNVSVSFDVNPTVIASQTIARNSGSNTGGLTFTTGSTGLYAANFNSSTNTGFTSTTAAVSGTYAAIALTFAATSSTPDANGAYTGTGIFYLNGVQQGSSKTVLYTPGGGVFAIGGRGNSTTGSSFFSGLVDEFAVYNQTLTQSQITLLASGSTPPSVVPEPASLGALGLLSVAALCRRRR